MRLQPGAKLAQFEILDVLGAGGMGEVYRARDTTLRREVALKVLPEAFADDSERLHRLQREARSLAALNHPHIAAIHGFDSVEGVHFLVLELVPGPTLAERVASSRLPLDQAIGLCRQVAEALEEAHRRGIVHRDLKPANIKLTREGRVKVLDFGLAKMGAANGPASATAPTLTSAESVGQIQGTAAYMSPEQARGEEVDKRTDIWAFGCLLYEVLTGRRAFRGGSTAETLAAVLTAEPDWSALPAGAPKNLHSLVRRCLQKDKQRRLHDIADARLELEETLAERSAPGSGADKLPRLAVLPFEDLGAPENAHFAAGMTQELIAGLAAVHGLEVVSRTTVTQYSRAGKPLREIGRDLGVDYVLEGTVRWARGRPGEDRVRISPQLIRVSDDTHLWAGAYDRDLADIFAVQSDIAGQVVRALGVTLSARERRLVEVPPTGNPEAYQLYLRGLQTLNSSWGFNLLAGADLMHRAAALDPDFALAHAREARALAWNYFLGGPAENRERAETALARAQAVAPDDPRVRLSAGWVYYHGARDHGRALLEFEAAGRAMPNNGDVPYAIGCVLRRLGRYDEALDRFARASELGTSDGLPSWSIDREIATTNWALRRYSEADRLYEQCLRVAPDELLHWSRRAELQLHWKGDTTAARAALAGAPPTLEAELVESRVLIELWDRRFAQAVALAEPHLNPRRPRSLEWCVAYADLRLGRAQEVADLTRRLIVTREEELAASPNNFFFAAHLGLTYALVGAREPALTYARKAVSLTASDAFSGPGVLEVLAEVYTHLGDREQAFALLPGLLEKAYSNPLNARRLQGEPWWDPLRDDPRFERLLARADAGSPRRGARMPPASRGRPE